MFRSNGSTSTNPTGPASEQGASAEQTPSRVNMAEMERYGNFVVNPAPIHGTAFRRGVILGPPTQRPTVILALALKTNEDAARFSQREAPVYGFLRRRPHPHVARVVADHVITTAGRPTGRLVVLPAAEGYNLHKVLSTLGPIPVQLACRTIVQIASAIAHCHMYGIVLREITVSKIFFADAQRRIAVLADLTGSHIVRPHPAHPGRAWVTDKVGHPAYVAPEVLQRPEVLRMGYDAAAVDIYALGVVFFVTLTGRFPFVANTPAELYRLITSGQVDWPTGLPPPVLALLMAMMSRNPAARPTAAAIVALPWVAPIVAEMGIILPGGPMSAFGLSVMQNLRQYVAIAA